MRRFVSRPVRVLFALVVLMTMGTATGAVTPGAGALGGPDSGPILHAVRIGNDGSFDRVVFEFYGDTLPASTVSAPEANSGSFDLNGTGTPTPLAGAYFVAVRMEPAAATYNAANFPDPLYSGPTSFSPADTGNVVQVVEAEDFEMVLVWYIGVRSPTTPVVHVLSNPTRVVVDIPHASASPASPVDQAATFTG